ncbi:MAG: hypothetical protein H8D45_17810 [Bacteroidetes bacterium]|nr:hypothetical protein [Bacteroidota bacterium]
MNKWVRWPDGKDFAFTVFDDTDFATLKNVKEVYSLLSDLGFKTTKSVWPIRGNRKPLIGGSTCEDPEYLKWILELKDNGFEIALHNVTFHSSIRENTIKGLDRFYEMFGYYPKSMANHADCEESIYWGNYRLTGFNEILYNIFLRNKHKGIFRGHIKGDKYFWGDICKKRIKYVRNFIFSNINTLKSCPFMPYHDLQKPYVNYWFASSEGPDVNSFKHCISEKNQDQLEYEGGACIMYTHFASGFYNGSSINPQFKSLMVRLGKKNGWFVPVSTLLDYLLEKNGGHIITKSDRKRIERKWLLHKLNVGTS